MIGNRIVAESSAQTARPFRGYAHLRAARKTSASCRRIGAISKRHSASCILASYFMFWPILRTARIFKHGFEQRKALFQPKLAFFELVSRQRAAPSSPSLWAKWNVAGVARVNAERDADKLGDAFRLSACCFGIDGDIATRIDARATQLFEFVADVADFFISRLVKIEGASGAPAGALGGFWLGYFGGVCAELVSDAFGTGCETPSRPES